MAKKKIEAMKKTEEFLIEERRRLQSPKKKVDVVKMLQENSINGYLYESPI